MVHFRLPLTATLLVFFTFVSATLAGPSLRKNYRPVPGDALLFLSNLPEKKVTLKLILQRGMMKSDSYRVIQSSLLRQKAPLLQAKSQLATVVSVGGTFVDSQNKSSNAFSPTSIKNQKLAVTVSKQLDTGTTLSAGISHGDNETLFVTTGSKVSETVAEVSLTQSLWKNRFGRQLKMRLNSAQSLGDAVTSAVEAETMTWMESLTDLFYQAWLAQAQVLAARSNLARKERLLRLTKLQKRRGVLAIPDVLQVKQTLLASEIRLRDTVDVLEGIWRNLVLSLKLPRHWIFIDPMQIPIGLDASQDAPVELAQRLCQSTANSEVFFEKSAEINQVRHEKQSAAKLLDAAKLGMLPELKFSVGLSANGVENSDRDKTLSDAFSAANPAWTVGLNFEMSMQRFSQKAELQLQLSNHAKLQAQEATLKSNFAADWVNVCERLLSWTKKVERLHLSLQEQGLRNSLEEERFRLGRGVLNGLILSGDDVTQAESTLNSGKIEARRAAWDILRKSGRGKEYLDELRAEFK